MITKFFKLIFSWLRPKVKTYRNYKKFGEDDFLEQSLTKTLLTFVNTHVPLKKRIAQRNQAPFMTKELRKAIDTRSSLKNKLNKNHNIINITAYKRQRSLCVSLRRKKLKSLVNNVTKILVYWK